MLLANSNPNDAAYHRIEEIHKAGERAAALTNQLLAFSGKQMLQPRTVNPADLLRDLEPVLSGAIGEGIEIIARIDKDLDPVRIDPAQVQQAILNLVANARDAMPGGGTLTIDLTNTELDESSARVLQHPGGPLCDARRDGYRTWYPSADKAASVRTVLYHQTPGPRSGLGACCGVRNCQAERRTYLTGKRAGKWDHMQDVPSAGLWRAGIGARKTCTRHGSAKRDDSGGGG